VQDNAEACVREVIGRLGDGRMRYEMDDGSAIEVAVRVDRTARSAVVDFAGTSPQQPGQLQRAARRLHGRRALRVPQRWSTPTSR
jgi:5-oxoprolinase (ATP-hydrolysing)